jgi:thiamine biosynthesis lipoprotein ApbE
MTGKNKFDTASVTLVSENCTEADAYTKAAYNMEASEALVFIEKK